MSSFGDFIIFEQLFNQFLVYCMCDNHDKIIFKLKIVIDASFILIIFLIYLGDVFDKLTLLLEMKNL